MKTANVADLRNNFAAISNWVMRGETVVITKRGTPFAKVIPFHETVKIDRMARLKRIFPEGEISGDAQTALEEERAGR